MSRIVVLGAGSAGCVVASRLTEEASLGVVLVEAGPDYRTVDEAPEAIRSSYVIADPAHDWGYVASDGADPASAAVPIGDSTSNPVFRGKVVGGSSSVNGTNALRAHPEDFDEWVAAAGSSWAWSEVLEYFRRVEDDSVGGPYHGTEGPVLVRRCPVTQLRPVQAAFLDACAEIGFKLVDDLNGPAALGAAPMPMNNVDGLRQSAAFTYLAQARGRENLEVRGGITVDRLEIRDQKVVAALCADGSRIEGDVFVLSAGCYGSPAVLLRSGIGPKDELGRLGVDCLRESEAVGRNLRDQPFLYLAYEADAAAVGDVVPPIQTALVTSRTDTVGTMPDINLVPITLEPGQLLLGVGGVRPRSIGSFSLTSADVHAAPRICLNLFGDDDDVAAMVQGFELARALADSSALGRFVGAEIFPGRGVTGDELARTVRSTPTSYAHGTGTCRMGTDPADSVVDPEGRAYGFENLWVVDASIMPALPSAPTNLTTMMLAEKCVTALRSAI